MKVLQLRNLVDRKSPKAVLDEVHTLFKDIFTEDDLKTIDSSFAFIVALFHGDIKGYQSCTTEYHDLIHTTDTFLALARLIDGATRTGKSFTPRHIILCLASALFHDAGFIQEEDDLEGTGAKHTKVHVQRGIAMIRKFSADFGYTEPECFMMENFLLGTEIIKPFNSIPFTDNNEKLLASLLSAADLISQMSDPAYLEKLLYLYYELEEAGGDLFDSANDLLCKTVDFYDFVNKRLGENVAFADRCFTTHFVERWQIDQNLYEVAIQRQKDYLENIVQLDPKNPYKHLRREQVVERITDRYGYCYIPHHRAMRQ